MSKVFSEGDAEAEATASARGAAGEDRRVKSRPAAKAGGPVRSHRQKPAPPSALGREAPPPVQRRAAAILEVLAGERTPAEAARTLGVSVMHYYLLERKAVQGLVAACAPRPAGPPGPRPEQEVVRLRRELERSRRECLRQAALVRTTQRALGFPATAAENRSKTKEKPTATSGKRSGRRRATVRALRAAQHLRQNSSGPEVADVVQPSPSQGSTPEATLPRLGAGLEPWPRTAGTSGDGAQEFRHDTHGQEAVGHGTRGPPAGLGAGQAATHRDPGDASG